VIVNMHGRTTIKNVQFCSKNKFEKLVHLVGFIIRIYHDARSSERQIRLLFAAFSHTQRTQFNVR
jgi:hypothetical protein